MCIRDRVEAAASARVVVTVVREEAAGMGTGMGIMTGPEGEELVLRMVVRVSMAAREVVRMRIVGVKMRVVVAAAEGGRVSGVQVVGFGGRKETNLRRRCWLRLRMRLRLRLRRNLL